MSESSDRALLDLIRRGGPLTVADMAASLGVTATAIRNRLTRLLGAGLVERQSEHQDRGRPKHTYRVSVEAQKRLGQNYADLALVLWDEMMSTVADRKLRRLLVYPGDRPSRRDLSVSGERPGVGRAAGPAHQLAARPRRRGRSGQGSRRGDPGPPPALVSLLRACRVRPARSAPSSGKCLRKCWDGASG